MDETSERNAVLIFIAPRAHKFAVVGNKAIHQKCGEHFWQRVVTAMHHCFRQDKFTEGIGGAIAVIGDMLAAHFPRTATSSNASGLYFPLRSEFLKLRRWSLGLRRWT